MYGTRISLVVAFVAALVNMVIGILYGGVAGYVGGMVDTVMMRIVGIISTIPLTLYVILIMQVMGDGIQSIIVALGSVYWVDMARVVRGQVLSLKQQEFVLAAKTIGSSPETILLQHLIPNAMGSILGDPHHADPLGHLYGGLPGLSGHRPAAASGEPGHHVRSTLPPICAPAPTSCSSPH